MHSLASEILVVANIILLCPEINGLFPFPRFGGHIGKLPYTQSSNMHSSITSELPDPKKIERDSLIVFTHFLEEVGILHFGTLNQGYL